MTRATIRSVDIDVVELKFDKPLGGSGVAGVDIIVADIRDNEGRAGLGFSYIIGGGPGRWIAERARTLAGQFLLGKPLGDPAAHWAEINKSFNRTGGGPNLVALAALDVGLWDLAAVVDGVPLCTALGGSAASVPIYASGGFGPGAAPEASADLAREYAARGFHGVKPRVNARPEDEETIAAVRAAVGDNFALMVDVNEKGDVDRAARLLACAGDYGVAFVEEPLPSDDPVGYRRLGQLAKRAPIATGEHLQGIDRFAMAIADGFVRYIQPDLAMAGGLTPCREVARRAAAAGIDIAPHFLPGLFVHLSGASSNTLLLEQFPLIEPAFEGWPEVAADGTMRPTDAPGHGLRRRKAA